MKLAPKTDALTNTGQLPAVNMLLLMVRATTALLTMVRLK